jgi:Spy/CpxP family protein refolding chaperone
VSMATAGTTTPSGTPAGWRGRRVLVILLVASALLNLCFVGGAAWTRWHMHARWASPEQRYQQMAAELDLTAPQRAVFDSYIAAMRARTEKMHQQIAPVMDAAWEEIAKPEADAAKVTQLLDEAAEKRREFQREMSAQTLAFLATLTPAQRSKFVASARERLGARMRSRRDALMR